ncbi:hypothetical protein POTOM_015927 [Populus tomentosa]|uniref:Bifunctional dihydrofolate reductase-thymidylate synthase n=1 Tax=Populus tomentosa TaxID=118781 RepID=A0A8X8A2S2_POPTO|nr:hypothetical protein POTOM_015927 [Populus tomentosa]
MSGDSVANLSNGNANTQQPDPRKTYQVVVAATKDMGIGKDGKLPWKLPSDLKFFKDLTLTTMDSGKKNAVIMGRKTWESIPLGHRPLPGRLNVVLTRSGSFDIATAENVVICGSMGSALELLAASPYCLSIEKVFVIGGGQILRESLNAPGCDAIHITEIETDFDCDTFIPAIDTSVFQPWYSSFPKVENDIRHCFTTYVRVRSSTIESHSQNNGENSDGNSENSKFEVKKFSFLPKMVFERHEEYLYLRMVQDIISDGNLKDDRTGTDAIQSAQKFSASYNKGTLSLLQLVIIVVTKFLYAFPIFVLYNLYSLVVRKYFGEALLKNSCGSSVVQQAPRSFRKRAFTYGMAMHPEITLTGIIGLKDREEGDLGPVYGFQWRHFGARYTDMHGDYTGQGFDQLLDVIDKIKNNPNDRRIIISAWNPSDLKLMALPPCHMFAQFYVANGELSCQMYQRSADMGLGVPFNIASYALLTCIIAHVCDVHVQSSETVSVGKSEDTHTNLIPGDFVHVIGDAHVYHTHIRPLQEQLRKLPKPFPILKINSEKKDIDTFVAADFKLMGYDPHQKIEMKMAV